MNDKTIELLMKARKLATAGFERLQWSEVLTAFGFECSIEKTRNTVTKYTIKSPSGETLTLEKEPGDKRIVFYKLGPWMKSIGFDLVSEASKVLGMETPDEERALKNLYERDLTNTGTCAVCGGNFKRDGTGIGNHGFQRPGDGMLHGRCCGVGYLPWELSPIGAEAYIKDALEPSKARAEERLEQLTTGQITQFVDLQPGWQDRKPTNISRELEPERFARKLEIEIGHTKRYIAMLTNDIRVFTARVANWKPDELPEVKHAGKFSPKA
jgi:hypothetical protein